MKNFLFTFICLFINIVVFAQTQYDYYEDDVAHSNPPMDGYTILGIIIFVVIGFIIWLIYHSIKEKANNNDKIKWENHVKESANKKQVIEEGGFICPICGKAVNDNNYTKNIKIYDIDDKFIAGYVKYCNNCYRKEKEYQKELDNYKSKKIRKEMPEWYGCFSLIVVAIANILAIVLGVIRHNDIAEIIVSMFGLSIIAFLISSIPAIVINIGRIFLIEPKRPFNSPSYKQVNDCNAFIVTKIQKKK